MILRCSSIDASIETQLARVVRESIVRYCLEPEAARRKQDALDNLLSLEATPAPDDYATWEADVPALGVGDYKIDLRVTDSLGNSRYVGEAWTGVPQPPLIAHALDPASGRRRVVMTTFDG